MNEFYRTKEMLKILLGIVFVVALCLAQSNSVFSAEDIHQLIVQGDKALAHKDYAQTASIGAKILSNDPQNLTGYRFTLIYCLATGEETAFNRLLNEAKRLGVPELAIDKLATEILYVGNLPQVAYEKLFEYEKKWNKTYGQSR